MVDLPGSASRVHTGVLLGIYDRSHRCLAARVRWHPIGFDRPHHPETLGGRLTRSRQRCCLGPRIHHRQPQGRWIRSALNP